MSYMLHGRIRTVPGRGADLAAILSDQANANPMPGCRLYLVATDPEDSDAVWVTEVWDEQSDHENSLQMPEVRERIRRAMPIIDRDSMTSQRLEAVAGIPA